MNLIQIAKTYNPSKPKPKKLSREEKQLLSAYLRGEINQVSVGFAILGKESRKANYCASCNTLVLRAAREGILQVK